MRNRAKCKLCGDLLESFHKFDYVSCKCGEISITGGLESYECSARDFKNFLRIDEDGREIPVKVIDEKTDHIREDAKPLSRHEKIDLLEEMIKNIERLPQGAMNSPITHYDLYSALLLLSSILKDG